LFALKCLAEITHSYRHVYTHARMHAHTHAIPRGIAPKFSKTSGILVMTHAKFHTDQWSSGWQNRDQTKNLQ